jgi:ubiquitin-protein ligase E3 C
LQSIILTVLERRVAAGRTDWPSYGSFIVLSHFLATQIPAETSQNAQRFYRTLSMVVSAAFSSLGENQGGSVSDTEGSDPLKLIVEVAVTPLKAVTGYTLDAYEAFGCIFTTLPLLSSDTGESRRFRDLLANTVNYKLLANALATLFKTSGFLTYAELAETPGQLRLLGCFIYFHRYAHNFHNPEAYSAHRDFVTVVSMLLNTLPNRIIDDATTDAEGVDSFDSSHPSRLANDFLRDQIMSLVNQESVGGLLSSPSLSGAGASEDEKVDEARQLANYALALLRFFPRRGDEIRMWLYLGPSTTISSQSRKTPAIRYFWEATKRSSIFTTISRDSRAAIELLKPKSGLASSAGPMSWDPPASQALQNAVQEDEWRVILVFLELYTFVLKVMDDEEFFSAGGISSTTSAWTMTRDNALPLSEVKDLSTFLKNLGFTLNFNASDISVSEEQNSGNIGLAFFNVRKTPEPEPEKKVEASVLGVAGLSMDYVKGLVTGLLRMVYERDSRRKFLPADHWLMTSRFDMTGFIPAVVNEEESRHMIEEQDAEDIEEEDEEEFDDTPQLIGTGRTQQQRRLERLQRQQRKASRRRYLQAVAPRLEILQNMPFFIPFTTRVQIFREFVKLDMTKRRGSSDPEVWRMRIMHRPDAPEHLERHHAKIRREHEFDDAFQQFYPLGQGLKEPIQITFVDQFDTPEAGIDGGGVTKEFLTSVTNKAFMPSDSIDLFVENDQHLLYPNPSAIEEQKELLRQAGLREGSIEFKLQVQQLLQRYEFLGRIIGKCLYEGILVDVNFAPFFLRKWALTGGTGSAPKESGYRPTLNDLRDLDEGLYQGLHQLKNYTGDVEDFSLNFTVTDTVVTNHATKATKAITKELQPNGSNIPVTNQNRLVYISYMARHRLQYQPYQQTAAFLKGLSSMIQPSWLSMFNHSELQTLIGGASNSIDVEDLRRNTLYGGTYVIGDDGLEHPTIQLFWRVMHSLSDGERRAVLKFVTSTPRAPLLGFGTLNPRFSIRDAGSDQERLPSTSTCVNLLKLPMYKNEATLKEKLLYSVFSGAGFDLS